MPQQSILFCEVFDIWGIEFMSSFLASFIFIYILLAVNYVSKWVEVIPTRIDDYLVIVNFVRSYLFYRFELPKVIINNQGFHFCNKHMKALLNKYDILHKVSTPYHHQTNSQVEIFNREIKQILEKTVRLDRKD